MLLLLKSPFEVAAPPHTETLCSSWGFVSHAWGCEWGTAPTPISRMYEKQPDTRAAGWLWRIGRDLGGTGMPCARPLGNKLGLSLELPLKAVAQHSRDIRPPEQLPERGKSKHCRSNAQHGLCMMFSGPVVSPGAWTSSWKSGRRGTLPQHCHPPTAGPCVVHQGALDLQPLLVPIGLIHADGHQHAPYHLPVSQRPV